MTTTKSKPTQRDQTWADTNRFPVGELAPARQGVVYPEGLRWWRADPEDWMSRGACRPRLTILGVFEDVG